MANEQKEKLIRFYKGTEGEETVIKLVDLAESGTAESEVPYQ
jgi:hypothetical protein